MSTPGLAGAVSGADLLSVCDTALKTNFRGMKGKMCTWYVTPCDCETVPASDLPRVCLSDPIVPRRLAYEVTAVLKAIPEFQEKEAEEAVATILSELYPCAE